MVIGQFSHRHPASTNRQAKPTAIAPQKRPALRAGHPLKDNDVVDFESGAAPNDIVSVIATEPLTSDETWDIYRPGEWRLWH
ncbi:class II glutamine amidotransferase, partial [Marinimicrobium alkaliphilum]